MTPLSPYGAIRVAGRVETATVLAHRRDRAEAALDERVLHDEDRGATVEGPAVGVASLTSFEIAEIAPPKPVAEFAVPTAWLPWKTLRSTWTSAR